MAENKNINTEGAEIITEQQTRRKIVVALGKPQPAGLKPPRNGYRIGSGSLKIKRPHRTQKMEVKP